MKIAVVMGTYRKHGAGAMHISSMLDAVKDMPGVETEYIWLGDCHIGLCRGCMACYDRGEACCPLKDGYLEAMQRLNSADAAIFYSPTYTLSISGIMKTFFDRSSYVLHRPYFKGRRALVLTAVDTYGDGPALKTLRTIVAMMGFDIAGAFGVVNVRYENRPAYKARVDRRLANGMKKLVRLTQSHEPVRPSLFELVAFRFQQAAFGKDTGGCENDRLYWKNAGWADRGTEFYCEARISRVKAIVAKAVVYALRKSGLVPAG